MDIEQKLFLKGLKMQYNYLSTLLDLSDNKSASEKLLTFSLVVDALEVVTVGLSVSCLRADSHKMECCSGSILKILIWMTS